MRVGPGDNFLSQGTSNPASRRSGTTWRHIMIMYGTALLAVCHLLGIFLGDALGHALGVKTGDKLVFEQNGKGVSVRPVRTKSVFAKYRGIGNPGVASGRAAIVRKIRELRGHVTKK